MHRWLSLSLVLALAPLAALGQTPPPAPSTDPAALAAVAKAWSLPPGDPGSSPYWPGAKPGDLAAAALLWKSGGPAPAEGWKLRQSEKSWEAAARKAGVAVDELLDSYRVAVGEKERQALTAEGGEWTAWAELRTLERLTGRNLRALASELAQRGFEGMLGAAAPAGGAAARRPRPAFEGGPASAPPGGVSMNPLQPELDKVPQNSGTVGSYGSIQPKGR
jgi:hypothetical protein